VDFSKRQYFNKIFNADGDIGKTFNSIFSIPNKKDRQFKGAYTKSSYGPAFDPSNNQFKTFDSSLTGGIDMSGQGTEGTDGAAMGESNNKRFIGLLEALKTKENTELIDTIKKGFLIIKK
jgi:hypothetical protein